MNKPEISIDRLNKIESDLSKITEKIEPEQFNEMTDQITSVRDRVLLKSGLPLNISNQTLNTKLTYGFQIDSSPYNSLQKGNIFMLQKNYEKAYNSFVECLGDINFDQSTIVNNMAISLVYQGKLTQAIQLLESRLDVAHHPKIIKNLTTLISLKCHDATAKKRQILEQISGQLPDYFDVSNFGLKQV